MADDVADLAVQLVSASLRTSVCVVDRPVALPLDKAVVERSWMMMTLKTAFMAGSSKQGKVFLACVACICDVAMILRDHGNESQR